MFHERIEAIHAYRVMKGVDPAPYWPGMWMWELVTMPPKRPNASVSAVIKAVCDLYAISRPELLSPSRHALAVRARHAACYLSRKLTRLSFQQIAAKLNRDHTVVIYAYKKVTRDMATDKLLASEIAQLTGELS